VFDDVDNDIAVNNDAVDNVNNKNKNNKKKCMGVDLFVCGDQLLRG
jgi:hypothetical protein